MKKVALLTLSTLSIDPHPAASHPKPAIWVRAYAQVIKVIGFGLRSGDKFRAIYSASVPIACFFALITVSALLPACSPCRVAMLTVSPADLDCTGSGFRISECIAPECPIRLGETCTQPTRWKATCKKDGREFDCEKYPEKDARCFK